MKRWLLIVVLTVVALLPGLQAWADATDQAAHVVTAYFHSSASEDLQAYLATRDLSPQQRQQAADFAKGLWARVGTRDLKMGPVEVAIAPDDRQALARCRVSAVIVNKETGESFAKQSVYVAVLVRRGGQWKVRRMLPDTVFRKVQREQMLFHQAQRLLEMADRGAPLAESQEVVRPSGQATQLRPTTPAASAATPATSLLASKPDNLGAPVSRIATGPTAEPSKSVRATAAPDSATGGMGRVLRVERGLVFIDQGEMQGVSRGQRYEVMAIKQMAHPVTGKLIHLPRRVALIQVLQVWPKRARCIVLDSRGELVAGLSVLPAKDSAK
ncbi:MAG: hypothetical protein KQI62_04400 [Deltaproteobacteria bacterium]|nr:hypothetical protein [Deltaproteobacteria bacterium]